MQAEFETLNRRLLYKWRQPIGKVQLTFAFACIRSSVVAFYSLSYFAMSDSDHRDHSDEQNAPEPKTEDPNGPINIKVCLLLYSAAQRTDAFHFTV